LGIRNSNYRLVEMSASEPRPASDHPAPARTPVEIHTICFSEDLRPDEKKARVTVARVTVQASSLVAAVADDEAEALGRYAR